MLQTRRSLTTGLLLNRPVTGKNSFCVRILCGVIRFSISFADGLASQTFLLRMAELFHVTHMGRHQAVRLLPIGMNGLGSLLKFSVQFSELPAELREFPLKRPPFRA